MRFEHLNIRAFGHFTDYELLFDPSKNFHLIYGPNEAGKSTTLRSITNFLYGFPQQTTDAFLHNNNKLRIEGSLKKANGETLQFTRRKGRSNTVLDSNEKPLSEELVNDFLNGISKENFLSMFALDHVRLREGGEGLMQSGGSLGESLFSAASGINMLRKLFEDLEKKTGDLYKKKAQAPKLNKLLKEQKELASEIAGYHLKIQAWKDLEGRYNDSKRQLEEMKQQTRGWQKRLEKLKRIQNALPKIVKLQDHQQKLLELGKVPALPENIEQLRLASQHKLEAASQGNRENEADLAEKKAQLSNLAIPDALLEQEAVIDRLYRDAQTYRNHLNALPAKTMEIELLQNQVISLMKDIDANRADIEKIELFRLSVEQKNTIRHLSKQKPLLDQSIESLTYKLNENNKKVLLREEELRRITILPNAEKLEEAIDRVKRAGQIETALSSLTAEIKELEQKIADAVELLPVWAGTYQELVSLKTPGLSETVKKYDRNWTELFQRLESIQKDIQAQLTAIAGHEERIRDLESLTEIPTEEKLLDVRDHREKGWQLIKTKLQTGYSEEQAAAYTKGQAIESVYEESVRNADNIADKMRIEAAKVGEKNKRLLEIETGKKKVSELETAKMTIETEMATWQHEWTLLWEPAGIQPLTPKEMQEWLQKQEQIREWVKELGRKQGKLLEQETAKSDLHQQLLTILSQFVNVSVEVSLNELLRIAEKEQKKILDDAKQRYTLESSIRELKDEIQKLIKVKEEKDQGISEWTEKWRNAIQGTVISESTIPAVAESLVDKYEETVEAYERLSKVVKEQEAIQSQIVLFETRVKELVTILSVLPNGQNADMIINQLHADLQTAKEKKVLFASLTDVIQNLTMKIKQAQTDMDDAQNALNHLFMLAHCSTIEELTRIEADFKQKRAYESEKIRMEEDLLQFGIPLEELIEEVESVEKDSINGEITEIQTALDDIEQQKNELNQSFGVVKKEYEEKILGNSTAAVLAEQKKESLSAQLADVTEEYIQLKLASSLLQKGIEYYRNQNQDPILRRASEIFAKLTLSSFAGLTVDYDDKDQPVLMGVRETGEKVPIQGMSDGTTDQLYLALRIASIEKYAGENEPLPFIVDDILVHFDDIRSKETLKILLELSKQTQIIFFTHHARLVDIIKEIAFETAYQLTDISSGEAVIV
jgi:uncharacterized protein YhaN